MSTKIPGIPFSIKTGAMLLALVALAANATEPPGHPFESDYALHSLVPDALGAWAAGAPFLPAHDSLGTKISRTMVHWGETEVVDDDFNFASTDSSILPVLDAGITVFLTLRNRHPVFVDCPDTLRDADGPPLDMNEYRKWVRAVVEHYLPLGIRHFQIGNEVWSIGHNKFWCSDLADYEDLLVAAGQEIHAVSDSAIVVPAGFASSLYADWSVDSNAELGLQMLADHPEAWDMLDLHLYRKTSNVDDTVIWIRQRLANAGLGNKLLISSECGGPDIREVEYSDSLHMREVIQRPCMVLGEGFDQMILWHIRADSTAHDIFKLMSLVEGDAGDWTPKPAFHAYDNFLDFVDRARSVQRVKVSDYYDQTYLYRWDKPGGADAVAVAWSWAEDGLGELIELPPSCRFQPYFGMYGNSLGMTDSLMQLDPNPVFIVWDSSSSDTPPRAPEPRFALASFPNPFNPTTEIRFELSEPARIDLAIFDASGRRVRELYPGTVLDAGEYGVEWDGRDGAGVALPSGIYLLRLSDGDEAVTGKLNLLK